MNLSSKTKLVLKCVGIFSLFGLASLSLVLRLMMLGHDLPYYSIDENDIVEPALAFVAGDWDPRWYKYGPLYSYILAIVYSVQQWVLVTFFNWDQSQFFYTAFFNSGVYYYIARSLHFLIIFLIAIVSFKFCLRNYDKQTAFVVLIFCFAPLVESVTNHTIRIDTLQGLFALLTLYYSVQFSRDEKFHKSYILSGLFCGLAFATKPLTGLLILPAVAVAHFYASGLALNSSFYETLRIALTRNKVYIWFLVSLVISHSIVHPYSVINFSSFWAEQIQVIFSKSAQGGTTPGYNFLWLFERWGFPLALLAVLSPLLLFMRKDKVSVVLLTYIVVFCLAFMLFKTRIYWYLSIIPALTIVMAKLFTTTLEKLAETRKDVWITQSWVTFLIAALFSVFPIIKMWQDVDTNISIPRSDKVAQEWVEKNVPPDSKIITVGWYAATLPRLLSNDARGQSRWGEYFMYRRNENKGWVNKYLQAYKQTEGTGVPRYGIFNIRKHYRLNKSKSLIAGVNVNDLFASKLPALAKKNNFQYLITASPTGFTGSWESSADVKLLAEFNQDKGFRGPEIKVFQIIYQPN